jgi:hypothetical protein
VLVTRDWRALQELADAAVADRRVEIEDATNRRVVGRGGRMGSEAAARALPTGVW